MEKKVRKPWQRRLFGNRRRRGTARPISAGSEDDSCAGDGRWKCSEASGPEAGESSSDGHAWKSSPWMAGQVAGGLKEAGVGVRFAGVVTHARSPPS